ncbi:Bug family tripartite tricarboxylate transporter substrate binding protein [Rhodoplanes sp. Z2-YC6860]|uniref:Bug family tripartite tricarboxylate transporter substrate binding protein n=1 Tax=Rhodoplanes sp. Z2-YC6860 TaxID=674703 RepID=UPI00078C0353|nr:tripartite tricarboxylate transporter substrate binding protein [Rhodoplanes sp. Z2-YC6860]AMN43096.1 extracytoplasmic binding recepto [Rhodoplanes sp. Z2-YC6860]
MKRIINSLLLAVALSAATLSASTQSARADETYPSKPIRIIDAYAPGGSSDLAMRMLIDAFSREIGQTAYIEVKSGGSGLVGMTAFLNSPPDGYTLFITSNALMVVIPAVRSVPYDPEKDLVPLGLIWHTPQVFATKPELKVKSLPDFLAYAKAHPNGVTLGSAGVGTVTHLSIELLKRETGIPITHVPFRSTSTSLTAVIGNQVDGLFGDVTMLTPYASSHQVNALAITGAERSRLLPELPTAAEGGLPSLGTTSWFGLVASPQTPALIIEKLKAALARALADPAYQASVTAKGLRVGHWDAASFAQLIRDERKKWTPVVREAGIKIE